MPGTRVCEGTHHDSTRQMVGLQQGFRRTENGCGQIRFLWKNRAKPQKHYLPKHCEHHTMMAFRRCQWAVNGVRRVRALSDTAAVTPPAKVSRYLSPHIAHRLLCTASPSPLALLPFCSFRVLRAPTRAFLSPASRLWIHGLSSNNSG